MNGSIVAIIGSTATTNGTAASINMSIVSTNGRKVSMEAWTDL